MAEVIKTISFVDGSADFATVQAAWDSLPADITAAGTDENFIFEFISEGEIFEPGAGTAVLLAQTVAADSSHDIVFRRRNGIDNIFLKGKNTTYVVEFGPLSGTIQEFVKVLGVSLIDGLSRTIGLFSAFNCA